VDYAAPIRNAAPLALHRSRPDVLGRQAIERRRRDAAHAEHEVELAAMMRDATKKFEEMRALKRQLKGWSQGAALNYRDSMYLRVNRGDQPETSQLVEPMIRLRYPRFANALQ